MPTSAILSAAALQVVPQLWSPLMSLQKTPEHYLADENDRLLELSLANRADVICIGALPLAGNHAIALQNGRKGRERMVLSERLHKTQKRM